MNIKIIDDTRFFVDENYNFLFTEKDKESHTKDGFLVRCVEMTDIHLIDGTHIDLLLHFDKMCEELNKNNIYVYDKSTDEHFRYAII